MARFHVVFDAVSQTTTQVPFTAEEEAKRDAEEAQWPTIQAAMRDGLVAQSVDDPEAILRAFVLVLLDELNLHSTTTAAILTAAANATNLSDFKNRMSQITAIPQRTASQLRSALLNKLGT